MVFRLRKFSFRVLHPNSTIRTERPPRKYPQQNQLTHSNNLAPVALSPVDTISDPSSLVRLHYPPWRLSALFDLFRFVSISFLCVVKMKGEL
jgi:hypothetical protein